MSGVPFDHRHAGTAAAEWTETVRQAPPLRQPARGDHVVVLAAHPDDETLGSGGLIASAAARGAKVTVIVATDGEASHPDSPTHSPAALAGRRRDELRAALRALAPHAELRLLGLPDGALSDHTGPLAAALAASEPATHIVTPWAGDRHPDHEACARAGAQLQQRTGAQHWQFPIWAWHWARPGDGTLPRAQLHSLRLEPPTQAAKRAALECHASQHQPLSALPGDEPILGAAILEHFRRDLEVFVVTDEPEIVSQDYFDGLYADRSDPWGLQDRFYERRKRSLLLASLTRPRFRRAFEPGCATGLLTAQLAQRCDEVVAWDIAGAAVAQTTERLAGRPWVHVQVGAIPDSWPSGRFDLIVLSELGYYCRDLAALITRVEGSLDDDGVLVACHWRHPARLHPQTAQDVHDALGAGRRLVVDHVEDDFFLQAWTLSGESVAVAEGVVS